MLDLKESLEGRSEGGGGSRDCSSKEGLTHEVQFRWQLT